MLARPCTVARPPLAAFQAPRSTRHQVPLAAARRGSPQGFPAQGAALAPPCRCALTAQQPAAAGGAEGSPPPQEQPAPPAQPDPEAVGQARPRLSSRARQALKKMQPRLAAYYRALGEAQRVAAAAALAPSRRCALTAQQPAAAGGSEGSPPPQEQLPAAAGGSEGSPLPEQQPAPPAQPDLEAVWYARKQVWFRGFFMLFWLVHLAAAVLYARTRLFWLFYDGPRLSSRAWQALLAQKMQPVFAAYYRAWGEAPRAAAAGAKVAAAVHSCNLSRRELFGFVFIVGCTLFVLAFQAIDSFLAALTELRSVKRPQ